MNELGKSSANYHPIIAGQKSAFEELYWSLRRGGFGFEHPDEAFQPPSDRTEEMLAYFAGHGCRVPAAVAEFYRQIGGINFTGWSSAWADDEYPDAIYVMPLDQVVEDFEQTYLYSEEVRAGMLSDYGGYYFPIAPDFYHKQNISGGAPYAFIAPNRDDDPKLLSMPWDLRFTEYLDLAIARNGFPGFDDLKHRPRPGATRRNKPE